MDRRAPEATELVYVPEPSWAPAILAASLAGILAGIFVWWPYGAIGAIVGLFVLAGMLRGTASDVDRLPRRQRLTTAVLPPVAPRKRGS